MECYFGASGDAECSVLVYPERRITVCVVTFQRRGSETLGVSEAAKVEFVAFHCALMKPMQVEGKSIRPSEDAVFQKIRGQAGKLLEENG